MAAATWQDALLGRYRLLHLTLAGLLVVAGTILAAASLTTPSEAAGTSLAALTCAFAAAGWWLSARFAGLLAARAADVDRWQREILLVERHLPAADRAYTRFKQDQRTGPGTRLDPEPAADDSAPAPLTDDQITEVLGTGPGQTRILLDRRIATVVRALWVVLTVGAVGGCIVRAMAW